MSNEYRIGAYYFPNYHVDPRNEKLYGTGWTEWELVKRATPRFPGHYQPRVPLWGYADESDPAVFAHKIDAAADHGIDHFIFDWYYYNDGLFLNRALEQGYLHAANRDRLQFALMWANHDWLDIMPLKRSMAVNPTRLYPGAVTEETFDRMTDYIVANYFSQPAYFKIDGCPYFSIYELFRLVESFRNPSIPTDDGLAATRRMLDRFRAKTKAAGFPDLHLNAVVWGVQVLPGTVSIDNPQAMLSALQFDSVTSYVWIHHLTLPQFPVTEYADLLAPMRTYWEKASTEYGVPYFPNVSMGWDSSPRTVQSDGYDNIGYPFIPTIGNNTPSAFREALEMVKAFLDQRAGQPRIFNVNAWNEWTEGSYLEPDTQYGLGYLEAIRDVFRSAAQ